MSSHRPHLQVRLPDGSLLPVPTADEAPSSGSVWLAIGRGNNGVPHTDQLVSRCACELFFSPRDGLLQVRVLGRNPLFLVTEGSTHGTSLAVNSETPWPTGATLYLLHSTAMGRIRQYGCVLERVPQASNDLDGGATLSFEVDLDPDATQDAHAQPSGTWLRLSPSPAPVSSRSQAARSQASARSQAGPPMQVNVEPPSPSILNSPPPVLPMRSTGSPPDVIPPTPSLALSLGLEVPTTASELPPVSASEWSRQSDDRRPRKRSFQDLASDDFVEVSAGAASSAAVSTAPAAAVAASSSTAASSSALATPASAVSPAPRSPSVSPASAAAVADAHEFTLDEVAMDFGGDGGDFGGEHALHFSAESEAAPAAAAASESKVDLSNLGEEPDRKRIRVDGPPAHVVTIKRSLEFLSSPSSPAAPPAQFLRDYAVFLVQEGIGTRQLEIVNANIIKRGGLILNELPKHRFYTHTEKKTRSSSPSASPTAPRKLAVLVIVSPTIRTRAALQDVLAARQRHQAAAELVKARARHLGVPRSSGHAASPPASPKTASPSGSGSSVAGGTGVRLRSSWQVHHLSWLVQGFQRNSLLPADQLVLDDMDPAKQLQSVASRKLDYPASSSASAASASSAVAPSSPFAAAASSAAADPPLLPSESDLEHEDDEDDPYADQSELTTRAAIQAWNQNIATQLLATASMYQAKQGEHFRAMSFRRAAGAVSSLPFALRDAESLRGTSGFGPSLLTEINSILTTGHSARLEALQQDPVLKVHQLLQTVHGVGPRTAEKLYTAGVRTIDDLRKTKLTSQQATYLQYYDELRQPIPREEVSAFERTITLILHSINPKLQLVVCGSYRRGKATCGDIDCLITHPDASWSYKPPGASSSSFSPVAKKTSTAHLLEELMRKLHAQNILTDDLVTPSNRHATSWRTKNIYASANEQEMYCGIGMIDRDSIKGWGGLHRRLDLKVYHVSEFPFALMYFTGSAQFNRAMRLYCNRAFDYSLSDKALSPFIKRGKDKVASGLAIPCASEKDIFAQIGMEYIPPTERDVIPAIFLETKPKHK